MTEAVLVGLTTYPAGAGHGPHTPPEYIDAVVRAGGVPVLLPHTHHGNAEHWIRVWLSRLDAVVLIGGGDIAPEHTARTHETLYGIHSGRDHTELALARALIKARLPTLAICRGLQLFNVALGGSLHPHLPDVVGETVAHRSPARAAVAHPVSLEPASTLAALLGSQQVTPLSWHHQAVSRLGHGLQAVAWADDGIIEALTLAGFPELIAVQWHPELTAGDDARQQSLFDEIVRLATQAKAAATPVAGSSPTEKQHERK
ncbi:gamma-glutamyl-gamma-aminobutyrate hydrolase family protein [Craterilacuibacter sp.]|uniref:gamma-glutamyl-gamma-aminobutyrate hydrolase family protein n=1 Tax=Craterilacuibacter sp. TaxID=2870909 RepID=UPI003F3663B1